MRKRVDYEGERDPWPAGTVIYGARNHWKVLAAEPVESKVWPWTWRYDVEPLGPHTLGSEARLFETFVATYRRGEGPTDVFGPALA